MYYEEKIINGILHHRVTPDGRWIPFTIEELSSKLIERKKLIAPYSLVTK